MNLALSMVESLNFVVVNFLFHFFVNGTMLKSVQLFVSRARKSYIVTKV